MIRHLIESCKKIRIRTRYIYLRVDGKFQEQFGFPIKETTVDKINEYLHRPKDSSSLAVTRILFGLAMLFDIPDERGGAVLDKRWGDPMICHFPLIPFIRVMPLPYMVLVYAALWVGALGITLGYKYRWSAALFTVCYWYLFLIEKSYWNNHSYLFGIIAFLIALTEANCVWSLDVYLDPTLSKTNVPYWNYFILKYQFFILYFMAGMKKGSAEWLTGYSVQSLSEHWVFNPFKLFLTVPQIDYLIVHWFVFAFDLTVSIWMMWSRTRHIAMILCALFHLMNSRLFRIGMFPWVCLATMPLFYPFNWPKIIIINAEETITKVKGGIRVFLQRFTLKEITCAVIVKDNKEPELPDIDENNENEENDDETKMKDDQSNENDEITERNSQTNKTTITKNCNRKKYITLAFIVFHVIIQAFLPYSHFITKGYNNWTNGLYGYSWDMMVHTWEIESVIVRVVDNENKDEFFVDPYIYSPNDRWTRHGDMVHQYARCLKDNIIKQFRNIQNGKVISENVSIYVDVLCSMNGRFAQRMFDPKADLLTVPWSPFTPVSYLMPLLDDALEWRGFLDKIREDVYTWNSYSDVTFFADFPGYYLEKYIPIDLTNITLTILDGNVAYEPEVTKLSQGQSYRLSKGNRTSLDAGTFHRVLNIGETPAFYMYIYTNKTDTNPEDHPAKPILPIGQELSRRFYNMIKFANIICSNVFKLFYKCCQ